MDRLVGDVPGVDAADAVARELEQLRARIAVTIEIADRMVRYVGEDGRYVAAVVDNIIDRWRAIPERHRPALVGPGGFTAEYVDLVERDEKGGPWWQLCQRQKGFRFEADWFYGHRVWTHHAGWLVRLHRPDPTLAAVNGVLPEDVGAQLLRERLRAQAAYEVARDVSLYLTDPAKIEAAIDDVVDNWLGLPVAERATLPLTGMKGFTDQYMTSVLYERADEEADVLWDAFCPDGEQHVDLIRYGRDVWTHHLAQVTRQTTPVAA